MILYADSSALIRAYFEDEPDHEALRLMLLEDRQLVISSALARVELASAVRSGARAGRIHDEDVLQKQILADCGEGGPVVLVELRGAAMLPVAYELVRNHKLRTLDAIHLAVALEEAPAFAGSEEVVLVTRDADQAAAARSLGLDVR